MLLLYVVYSHCRTPFFIFILMRFTNARGYLTCSNEDALNIFFFLFLFHLFYLKFYELFYLLLGLVVALKLYADNLEFKLKKKKL